MAFIDRDPQEMMRYATSAKKYVDDVTRVILGLKMATGHYMPSLDDNCRNCCEKVIDDCEKYLDQIRAYDELARQIEKKAKQQMNIKPSF